MSVVVHGKIALAVSLRLAASATAEHCLAMLSEDERDIFAAAEGDRDALGLLYDRHAPSLLALARVILKDAKEAEDLLHDVFVEVWRCAGDYDPERGSVSAWLRLRVRSRALDRVRSPRIKRARPLDDQPEGAHDARLDERADVRLLLDALGVLPGEQRDVLCLGYFEGLSSTEIAARIGIPVGTVKSRVAAALAKLRSQMAGGAA